MSYPKLTIESTPEEVKEIIKMAKGSYYQTIIIKASLLEELYEVKFRMDGLEK